MNSDQIFLALRENNNLKEINDKIFCDKILKAVTDEFEPGVVKFIGSSSERYFLSTYLLDTISIEFFNSPTFTFTLESTDGYIIRSFELGNTLIYQKSGEKAFEKGKDLQNFTNVPLSTSIIDLYDKILRSLAMINIR